MGGFPSGWNEPVLPLTWEPGSVCYQLADLLQPHWCPPSSQHSRRCSPTPCPLAGLFCLMRMLSLLLCPRLAPTSTLGPALKVSQRDRLLVGILVTASTVLLLFRYLFSVHFSQQIISSMRAQTTVCIVHACLPRTEYTVSAH